MNKSIRAACVERSEGRCEGCGKWAGESLHADHFWGRAKADETEGNVWMLCPRCDDEKTRNYPSNAFWVLLFRSHSVLHHYEEQIYRCDVRLAVLTQKGLNP